MNINDFKDGYYWLVNDGYDAKGNDTRVKQIVRVFVVTEAICHRDSYVPIGVYFYFYGDNCRHHINYVLQDSVFKNVKWIRIEEPSDV
jgi:hypothetical protein